MNFINFQNFSHLYYQKHITTCNKQKKSIFTSLNFWNFGERNQQEPIPKKKKWKMKRGEKAYLSEKNLNQFFSMNI